MLTIIFDEITKLDHFQTLLSQISKEYINYNSIELLVPYREEKLLVDLEKLLSSYSAKLYWRVFQLKENEKSILPLFKQASSDKIIFIRHQCLFTIGVLTYITNLYDKNCMNTNIWKITSRFENADRYSGFIPDGLIMEWLDNKIESEAPIFFMMPKDASINDEFTKVGGYVFYDGPMQPNDLFEVDYTIEEKDNLGKYYARY
jgi:hypothetical protein